MPLGVGTAVVLSSSMEPTLEVNDWVIIRRTNQVDVGDVVVYQQGRDLIIHRLVAQDGEILYTQGDASKTMDEPVELSAVKGVMVGRVPYVGALIRFLKKPTGVALVLLAAIVVTEGSFQRQRARDEAQLEAIKADIRRLQRERK
jgi:signal peptidase I